MSYHTLQNYNSYEAGSCCTNDAPTPMSIQVVPVYSPPGYDALTYGQCSEGHVSITDAYSKNCDQTASRLCGCNFPGPTGSAPPGSTGPAPPGPTGSMGPAAYISQGYRRGMYNS